MPTIAVNEQTHKEAKALCKNLGINLGEFVKSSTHYFKRTGIDPSKSDNESPHKVVKELERRIGQVIAFIKTQERDKLNPLLEHLVILSRALEDTLEKAPKEETFIKVMNRVSEMEEAEQKNHLEQMQQQQKYYRQLLEHLQNNYMQLYNSTTKKVDEMTEAVKDLTAQQQQLVNKINSL